MPFMRGMIVWGVGVATCMCDALVTGRSLPWLYLQYFRMVHLALERWVPKTGHTSYVLMANTVSHQRNTLLPRDHPTELVESLAFE
jgi:hypothetical protein